MMRIYFLLICLWLAWGAETQGQVRRLLKSLRESTERGIMFGHHDDPLYGYHWARWSRSGSDTYDVMGAYPAMMSFDLSCIEGGRKNHVLFDQIRTEVQRQHARGGHVTFSWHADNIVTGGNAWDLTARDVVKQILPGGVRADSFQVWLDYVSAFFLSLTDEKGKPIPVIFRPWHECNGTWFWWGSTACTIDEYKSLWQLTVSRLRKNGVRNVVYAFSPGAEILSERGYLMRYPGDEIISILGVEGYAIRTTGADADRKKFIETTRHTFDVAAPIAARRKKILAFTETGTKHNTDTQWWTKALWPSMEGYPVCYMVTWRNATHNENECYGIYKGHPSEADFIHFTQKARMIFRK